MIAYKDCLSDRHLAPLGELLYRQKFPSIAKAIEYAIVQLIAEHVDCGHIDVNEPHNAQTVIKKNLYLNEGEFVRTAVRNLLRKERLWAKKSD